MLFNSYPFIFVFLPLTLLGCLVLARFSRRVALAYVAAASLVFYGYWAPKYLLLLVPSLVVNYALGRLIARTRSKAWLVAGLAGNLAVIGWFKYSLFLYLTATGGATPPDFLRGIVLPLGISFITFQKIAYLVDVWRGRHAEDAFDRFAFFVLFFPQLIAGPIVLYREIEPQLARWPGRSGYLAASFQVGLVYFAIGLFKKVVLADALAPFANDIFKYASLGGPLAWSDAWLGALAYSLQLYFDFSAYSDMALGLGRMFGFRLPINFNSPYKARDIIDFWRRWHMTLTRFFRDYVYIPLGGNRKGLPKQVLFILIVFFLTGLWHGAGWTFVLWGSIHGVLVAANHLWNVACARWSARGQLSDRVLAAGRLAMRATTLVAVIALWVVFRADSWPTALRMLGSMTDPSAVIDLRALRDPNDYPVLYAMLAVLWPLALAAPSSHQLVIAMRRWRVGAGLRRWIPAAATGAALYLAIASIAKVQSAFIYFNF